MSNLREFDQWIAETVMNESSEDPPPYSTDAAAAMLVVDKLANDGFLVVIRACPKGHRWEVGLNLNRAKSRSDFLPDAICQAAKMLKGDS